jgi:hypothetical protein
MRIGMRPARATGLLVLAGLVAGASALGAQGGRALSRARETAATSAPAHEDRQLAPARSVLHALVGTWHFEVRFAGNFDGPPDASGTRVMTPLFDTLRLAWTEALDHSRVQGQGVIGFDGTSSRFFNSAIYSADGAPEFMAGTLDDAEPLITFRPLALAPDSGSAALAASRARSFTLSLFDENHFALAPLDHAWRASYTRQP